MFDLMFNSSRLVPPKRSSFQKFDMCMHFALSSVNIYEIMIHHKDEPLGI